MKENFNLGSEMSISNAIKQIRTERNLKQEDVAEAINVSVQTYSKWESGKTEPKASQIVELSKILNTSVDRLLFDREDSDIDRALMHNLKRVSQLRPRDKAMIIEMIDAICYREHATYGWQPNAITDNCYIEYLKESLTAEKELDLMVRKAEKLDKEENKSWESIKSSGK